MHSKNVRMLEVTVNLDFSSQLKHNVAVDNLSLGDHLDRHNGLRLSMSCQVHMAVPKNHNKVTFPFQDAAQSGSR